LTEKAPSKDSAQPSKSLCDKLLKLIDQVTELEHRVERLLEAKQNSEKLENVDQGLMKLEKN
jgi:hypothetical protein